MQNIPGDSISGLTLSAMGAFLFALLDLAHAYDHTRRMARRQHRSNLFQSGGDAVPPTTVYRVVVARAAADVTPPRSGDVRMTQPAREHLDTKAAQSRVNIISESQENGKRSPVIDRRIPLADFPRCWSPYFKV